MFEEHGTILYKILATRHQNIRRYITEDSNVYVISYLQRTTYNISFNVFHVCALYHTKIIFTN
jgi:hypothetical protein